MPDSFLDALDAAQRATWWEKVIGDPGVMVVVAIAGTALVGFSSLMASRDDDASPGTCEIATLYVDPENWRSGCGRALLGAAVDIADQRGFRQLSLWVLASNLVARAFYESLGFSPDGGSKTDSRLGVPLHELRYRRQLPGI